jgi:putative transposase
MSNFRRVYVPGGSYFFTVVTERRATILGTDLARDLLRAAFRDCFERWPPFRLDAMVMQRDHLHGIWTMPINDTDYCKLWFAIKLDYAR